MILNIDMFFHNQREYIIHFMRSDPFQLHPGLHTAQWLQSWSEVHCEYCGSSDELSPAECGEHWHLICLACIKSATTNVQ